MTDKKSGEKPSLDAIKRQGYLVKRGIKNNSSVQLDLQFDLILRGEGTRFIPNDYARSALFSAKNKNSPREAFHKQELFHLHEGQGVAVVYTGTELRADDDELVWLQIMHYGKSVPLGEPVTFRIIDLVRDCGWHRSEFYYERARESITRLKANEVLAINQKAYGSSGALSLIEKYTAINDRNGKPTTYTVWINPNMIYLFAGNTFTVHNWVTYRKLSPVARRLADYVESHKTPFPLCIKKFQQLCSSADRSATSWRQTVRKACKELIEANIATVAEIHKDFIHIIRSDSFQELPDASSTTE